MAEVKVPNRPAHPAGDIPGLSWTYFLGVIITAGPRGMQRPALVTTDEKIRQRRIKRQRHRFPNMQRRISATRRRESAVQDPVTHSGPSHDFAPEASQPRLALVFLPNTSSNYLTSKRSGLLVVVCSGLLPSREGPSEVTVGSQNKDSARLPVRHSGYGQETALGRRFAPRIPPSPPRRGGAWDFLSECGSGVRLSRYINGARGTLVVIHQDNTDTAVRTVQLSS
ncbi:hypothetical protein Bbelb_346970 [Branchiostoma belcheri]|nr:hypothetical protein Bbelb_346970 [Branchiostoma belcheri]